MLLSSLNIDSKMARFTAVHQLTHSAFVSVFPLLLILVTILGLIASGDQAVRHEVLKAVANQFPQIGSELTKNVGALRRSSMIGLIVGFLGLIWGATGLAGSSAASRKESPVSPERSTGRRE